MDAESALADLTELASQVEAAVVLAEDGGLIASTLRDARRAEAIAGAARDLLAAGDELTAGDRRLVQLEVSLHEGSVFVVRDQRGCIAATTTPRPTSGLVFYDLRACLGALFKEKPKPQATPGRSPRKKAASDA